MRAFYRGLVGLLLIGCVAGSAAAATVTLKNGDHLTGELRGIRNGRLLLSTEALGEIALDISSVSGVSSDEPVVVYLENGDRVAGRLSSPQAGKIRVAGETGDFVADITDLAGLGAGPVEGKGAALRKAIEVLGEEEKAEPKSAWSAKIEFGANYSSGNTDRKGFHVAFSATRTTTDDIFAVVASTLYSEENGNRTVNEQHLSFREDIKFDPWYVFTLLAFERDEFEDLKLRAVFAPGVGRVLIDEPDTKAKVEVGPSLTYEDYNTGDSNYTFQIRIGFHGETKVFDQSKITEDLQIFPGIRSGIQWRIVSDTSFENPLSEHMFFKLSVLNDYNTDVRPEVDRWDLKVLASLVYTF